MVPFCVAVSNGVLLTVVPILDAGRVVALCVMVSDGVLLIVVPVLEAGDVMTVCVVVAFCVVVSLGVSRTVVPGP